MAVLTLTVQSGTAAHEFACHSKACAPPPAGRGGSSKASHVTQGTAWKAGTASRAGQFLHQNSKIKFVPKDNSPAEFRKAYAEAQRYAAALPKGKSGSQGRVKVSASVMSKLTTKYDGPVTGVRHGGRASQVRSGATGAYVRKVSNDVKARQAAERARLDRAMGIRPAKDSISTRAGKWSDYKGN